VCIPCNEGKVRAQADCGKRLRSEEISRTVCRVATGSKAQLLVVLAVSFALRTFLATSFSVDIDEAGSYAPAALSYLNGDWTTNYEHPMLVKLLFAGSVALFGADGRVVWIFPWLVESIGALRLVSVVLGTGTCLVVYLLVREVTDSHIAAFIASGLLAFDPISLGESSYGILDPGMTFFYMASILFFYRYMRAGRTPNFYVSAILFGMSVASKYYAFIAIFTFLGVFLWKRKLGAEWKSMAVFLGIAVAVFFAVQPYLWSSPLVNLSRSWVYNRDHLLAGQLVKVPGNPFLIPELQFMDHPWLYFGSNPIASKPDFWASSSEAVQSPWWYLLYIQAMYSTPFQMFVYPLGICRIIRSVLRRRMTDLTVMAVLLVSIPAILFALMTVRLPQYAILLSTSSVVLASIPFVDLKKQNQKYLLVLLAVLHVGWTLCVLSASAYHFTGWGFYLTPLTRLIANLFNLLWRLG
jgi:4-amino-4-deoxy-L-arabinose transferase-like glycosyltransferase